jgi:hypothetical protein
MAEIGDKGTGRAVRVSDACTSAGSGLAIVRSEQHTAKHAAALRQETWGSEHHLAFAIGIAECLEGEEAEAFSDLA